MTGDAAMLQRRECGVKRAEANEHGPESLQLAGSGIAVVLEQGMGGRQDFDDEDD